MSAALQALMCFKDIDFVAAITLVAKLGDFHCFAGLKQSALQGLAPSEFSCSGSGSPGGITKTGNGHLRRVVVEAAWCYRSPSRMSRLVTGCQQEQPRSVREIAWRVQVRLCARHLRLTVRGMHTKIGVSVERELAAFV